MKQIRLTVEMDGGGMQVDSQLDDAEAHMLQAALEIPRPERSTAYLVKTVNGLWVADLTRVVFCQIDQVQTIQPPPTAGLVIAR